MSKEHYEELTSSSAMSRWPEAHWQALTYAKQHIDKLEAENAELEKALLGEDDD